MGSSHSTPQSVQSAQICQYNKYKFNKQLDIIRDAHNVTQFYANILTQETLPLKLDEYRNYTDETEEYFNPTRKVILPDLGTSYYALFQYIEKTLKDEFESSNNKENQRRDVITNVFNKAFIVQKYIIEDLWESCNDQGGALPFSLYPGSATPVEGSSDALVGTSSV
jgi:hypothetical protein